MNGARVLAQEMATSCVIASSHIIVFIVGLPSNLRRIVRMLVYFYFQLCSYEANRQGLLIRAMLAQLAAKLFELLRPFFREARVSDKVRFKNIFCNSGF